MTIFNADHKKLFDAAFEAAIAAAGEEIFCGKIWNIGKKWDNEYEETHGYRAHCSWEYTVGDHIGNWICNEMLGGQLYFAGYLLRQNEEEYSARGIYEKNQIPRNEVSAARLKWLQEKVKPAFYECLVEEAKNA
jgi:hypothetical protein